MAEVHLDHPGEMSWWVGHGPAPILGDCPHTTCEHRDTGTIAHGPDYEHYELVLCTERGEGKCDRACRGWVAVNPDPETARADGKPRERWWGFKAFDASREHHTTREERQAEDDRRAWERDVARAAARAAREASAR